MSIGDPPPFMPWCDALGYLPPLPALSFPERYDSLNEFCTQCGAQMRDHILGGPAPYHPVMRPALWFWQ